jgi:hypothetical protein
MGFSDGGLSEFHLAGLPSFAFHGAFSVVIGGALTAATQLLSEVNTAPGGNME